jgi:UDP-N-acetylglucosamine 4,6-dehydratase
MCPQDDSHLTIEFDAHYVIKPSIIFAKEHDYTSNLLGEKGKYVKEGFVYDSGTNAHFLDVNEIKTLSEIL